MMYEGKHIHYSPVDNKPLCSYSAKLCKQRRLNGYAFCIRHILEDKSAPFKQCAHVAKYNNQKCTNPIPSNEDREYCNSHMQVAGMAPKKERKTKKDKDISGVPDGKLKFADRLKALLKTGNEIQIDDPVSVDDPYAFPDPASETSQDKTPPGSHGNSPKAQEAHLKPLPELSNKLEQNKTICQSENKTKSNAAKSSKTMNRLQAKIAQNKILDKLKKNQDSNINPGYLTNTLDSNFSKNGESTHSVPENLNRLRESTLLPANLNGLDSVEPCTFSANNINPHITNTVINCSGIKTELPNRSTSPLVTFSNTKCHSNPINSVSIQPNKSWKMCSLHNSKKKVPELLLKVQQIWELKKRSKADLYPLGTELSDSDSEESDSEPVQRHWFYSWDKNRAQNLHSESQRSLRTTKLELFQCEMRRKYNQMCKSQLLADHHVPQCTFVNALIESAKQYPCKTAEFIQNLHSKNTKPKKILKSTGLLKRHCCYRNDKEVCESQALPYTRHCVKHIMYNVDQLLYEHCTAKFADNTQCCVPVFDICHELPLCQEHARKRDNYNRMSAEPKPKKPRKKTKPSALTRPPKRGKKKKRQSGIRPNRQLIPSGQSNAETSSTDTSSNQNNGGSMHPQMSPVQSEENGEDIAKELDEHLESELENGLENHLSPGSIEKSLELPLDTAELANQATRLLEEHDFTEVLNKIPDDAFNDLFTESKNGDFLPTKEETEELERALAAVDKDVKSLEKLSVENNDISELANSMDLHNSLLNTENLTQAIDESTLSELTQGNINIDNLNVITNSLSTNDLNSISQVLSNITTDSLVPNPLPANLVDGAILQNHLSGVHLLPDIVHGQLQLQVPVGATQATNFVLSPQLLGATFTTDGSPAQSAFNNGSTIPTISAGTFPQALAQTIPLAAPEGISISLQSQLQGIRTGQWILNPADQTFTPMIYQNGFPLSSQPFAQQVSAIGNLKFPFQAAVDVLKPTVEENEVLTTVDQTQTFSAVSGSSINAGSGMVPTTLTNAFPVQTTDSPKETVS